MFNHLELITTLRLRGLTVFKLILILHLGGSVSLLSNLLITDAYAQTNSEEDVFDDKRGDVSINQETLDKAETAFFKGLSAYRAKKYKEAAKRFKTAHKLVPYRDLLFNIARAYEELKQNEKAVKYYKQYLSTKPIDETQVIHRMRQLGVSRFEPAPKGNKGTDDLQLKTEPIPKGSETQIDWLSWSVLGGGIALVSTSAYFGLSALDSAESARNATKNAVYSNAKSEAESQALVADVSMALGLAVTAGGLYLLFTQPSSQTSMNTGVYRSHIKSKSRAHLESNPKQKNAFNQESLKQQTLKLNYLPIINEKLQGFAIMGQF